MIVTKRANDPVWTNIYAYAQLPAELRRLDEIAHNIAGRSFCPLGDAAATPIMAGIKRFRDEFEAGLTTPARELFPYEASANYARGGGR